MIANAQEVWDRALTKLGKRTGGIARISTQEIKEWIDDCQLEMAQQVPLKMSGALKITRTIAQTLTASPYPGTCEFNLPTDCIGQVDVWINLGAGLKHCNPKEADEKRWLTETNQFYGPEADYPWAIKDGRRILITPSTAGPCTVVLDFVKIPQPCTDDLAIPIELEPVLRELLVLKVAARALTDKLQAPQEGALREAEFAARWEQDTGVSWKVIPREEHKPAPGLEEVG